MVKRKSLRYQFKRAVELCFKPRMSRRKIKEELKSVKEGSKKYIELSAVITSYKYRDSIFDLIDKFVAWLKKTGQYSDFKYCYEIDSYVWVDFLRYLRFERNYSYKSLKNFASRIRKLEKIMSYVYPNSEFDYTSKLDDFLKKLKKDDAVRIYCLSFEDYKKLLQYLSGVENPKPWQLGLLIQASFGLRSFEVVNLRFCDIKDWNGVLEKIKDVWAEREKKGLPPAKFYLIKSPYNLYLAVKGKGGQWRFVPALTRFQYQIIMMLKSIRECECKGDMDKICECSTSRMRRELKNILISLFGDKFKGVATSTHMLRKTYARISYQFICKNNDKIERVVVSPETLRG